MINKKHEKSRALVGEVGGFVKKVSAGLKETKLGYPVSVWYFFGNRPLLTAFYFGGAQGIACVLLSVFVMVDRHVLITD